MSSTSTLAVIVGSVREGQFGPVVADWFVGQAKQRDDLVVNLIDLADTPIPAQTSAPGLTPLTPSSWSPPSTTTAILDR
jgi:NAD(P)H-dependent FMN reductase